jgi:lipopolysaccharide/colanic/teichoic acid biosynthesis glycosyltransferase
MGRPVIFKQKRPGYKNKIFNLLKFRTMSNERDPSGNLLPDEERLKSFGKYLRKYSLDELPSLINIIRGDMSFIGPRPLLVEYLSLYNDIQIKRHDVKPGFSGWAQINGRNNTSWEKRFKLDYWYVKNQSLAIDMKIFFITIWKTLFCIGVTTKEGKTMPPFKKDEKY